LTRRKGDLEDFELPVWQNLGARWFAKVNSLARKYEMTRASILEEALRLYEQTLKQKDWPAVSGGGGRGHFGGPVGAKPLIAGGGEWRNGCRPEPSQQAEVFVMSFLRHGQIYQSDVALD
jgi:hypothetical protein